MALVLQESCDFLRIIGIDPGYAIVGYGILDYANGIFKRVKSGVILTKAKVQFEVRLQYIYTELNLILQETKPDYMAIEKLYFTTNQKTAIDVAQARGVIMLAAVQSKIEVFEYTPLQIKQAIVGYGKAEKKQMINMVTSILKLKEKPDIDDEADALAVAVCHAHSYNPNNIKIQEQIKKQLR
ncbi:MAG: crossover junction endodeoxyribonuclease RuvC [Oscillospiraceae bacterium]